MAIRTRVRRRRRRFTMLPLLALALAAGWWSLARLEPGTESAEAVLSRSPQIASNRPEILEALPPQTDIAEKGAEDTTAGRSPAGMDNPPALVREHGAQRTLPTSGTAVDARNGSTALPEEDGPSAGLDRDALPLLVGAENRPKVAEGAAPASPSPESPSRSAERSVRGGDNSSADLDRPRSLIAAGKEAVSKGDLLAARTHFSDALPLGPDAADTATLRAELTRLGQETILSATIIDGDPHVGRYIVKPGDSLAKIAALHKVPADLLAEINGIRDKNLIRAGQTLKVVKGPFHAYVNKSDFTLDVYLDRTFVRHFRVGLGADNSTPTGLWQVDTKLINPTYYPPRGGQIVSADDPQNPLGERWIALKGVDGEALGQERYGIHGTNEPNSIGRSVSLGCVRMYNEDVEALYKYLIEKHSTVTITE